jgi:hypothetical protein
MRFIFFFPIILFLWMVRDFFQTLSIKFFYGNTFTLLKLFGKRQLLLFRNLQLPYLDIPLDSPPFFLAILKINQPKHTAP